MSNQDPPPSSGDDTPSSDLPAYGSFSSGDAAGGSGAAGGYPPPPPGAEPGFQPPFDAAAAIGYGWRKFLQDAGQWILAGLVVVVVSGALNYLSNRISGPGYVPGEDFEVGRTLLGLVVSILVGIVSLVMQAALTKGALGVTQGRRFAFGESFSGLPVVPLILTSLLVSIGTFVGFLLCIVPGIVFAFLTWFANYFVIDKGMGPWDAMTSSIRMVWSNIGNSLLLALLSVLVIIAGAIALCVGLFVAFPVVSLGAAYAYRRFQGEPVAD